MLTFCNPGRIESGLDSLSRIGNLVTSLGAARPLVIMDTFLASAAVQLDQRIMNLLNDAGIGGSVYSGISGEPTSVHVAEGIAAAAEADCIIAVGGGSAIDTAKAVAVLAINPQLEFADIAKQGPLRRLPLIAVPTTSGTGSEATKVAVITNLTTSIKENPGHPSLVPDIAVLDPLLTQSLPAGLTAFTGLDALTHAMEAYVSNKANSLSDLYAYEAMKLIGRWLRQAVNAGNDQEARQQMSLASYLAGVAFSNSSTNLAHAGGRALGAYFHIPHGLSVALLLPFVMEFGQAVLTERYAKVAIALGADPHQTDEALAGQALQIVEQYNEEFGIWREAKTKYIVDTEKFRQAIPEMAGAALAGNGILTNCKIPSLADVTLMFDKLAAKLETI